MSYFRERVAQLISQPGFHERPGTLLARFGLWLIFCAIGHSPRFRLDDEVWFTVDPVLKHSGSTSAFVIRDWAEPELHYLNHLVGERGAFIDCGANIGIYSVRGAGIVGSKGKVISVEPAAVSFNRLKRNIDLNKFSQVALVNKAISDREDIARLYHADGRPVAFSLVPKPDTSFEEVKTTTIDKLVEEHGISRVDCIKLDVEGAELAALHGAAETLLRSRPTIIFEQTSAGQERRAIVGETSNLITSLGYRLYRYAATSGTKYESPNVVAIHPDSGREVPSVFRLWNPG